MNKLKNKVFYTIFLILTISILSFIFIFNSRNYLEQKNNIIHSLEVANDNNKKSIDKEPSLPLDKPNNKDIKFLDETVYTILLDSNDDIRDIINHTNNNLLNSDISIIAKEILNNKKIKKEYIGLLYFSNYSYLYNKGESLIILDNSKVKQNLIISLEISVLIFILLEIIIYFISKIITNWIIKPVKDSFEKQKQFIADASHELKTPLSVITASIEAMQEYPKEKKWIKNIQNEAERMNNLITDLLELSISEEKDKYQYQINDLSKVVELSTLTFEGKAYEKNITIDYNIASDIKLLMNEDAIKELIEILLDNALKHSNKQSTIKVTLQEKSNLIQLLVQNYGEGIPKGEEEKIFQRFYRVDKSRNRNDNRYGLGLAIAKNIVLNHNGIITAESNEGLTTFKVLFKK